MRVEVDFDLCQGHAECEMEAPDWFTVGKGPDARVRAKRGRVPNNQIDGVRDAVEFCPTRALRLVDEAADDEATDDEATDPEET